MPKPPRILAASLLALTLACAGAAQAMCSLEQPETPATLPDTLRQGQGTASTPAENDQSPAGIVRTPQGVIIIPNGAGTGKQ